MAAIFFNPEGFSISGPRLMGRNAAGHSFLRGYLRYNTRNSLYSFTETENYSTAFQAFAASERVNQPIVSMGPQKMEELRQAGTLFLPGPGLDDFARKRSLIDRRGWSLCGITHTTLSDRAMDAIAGILTSPVEAWDALICTSQSVQDTVKKVLHAEAEYLQFRLGAIRFTRPKLPVIPLGIMAGEFVRSPSARLKSRTALGIADDEFVVLFVGRLSFHAKAHPAAMYRALDRGGKGQKITLIECGWFANSAIENAFAEAAEQISPNVKRIVLDGRNADSRSAAWNSADVFMSLTDNLQETFGITPIEAMASGLPVIVSDWDGYRDTVRDGIDGFRIPTAMPQSGMVTNSAHRYGLGIINYDYYCGETSHLVSVDIERACHALDILIANPDLRRLMGNTAQAYARATFDWSVIIKAYENLWEELAEERQAGQSDRREEQLHHAWSARMDPFDSFSSYPTFQVQPETRIFCKSRNIFAEIEFYRKLKIYTISDQMLPNMSLITTVLRHIPKETSLSILELKDLCQMPFENVTPIVMFGLKIGALAYDDSFANYGI